MIDLSNKPLIRSSNQGADGRRSRQQHCWRHGVAQEGRGAERRDPGKVKPTQHEDRLNRVMDILDLIVVLAVALSKAR